MSRLREKYANEVVPALKKEFGYKNVMAIPKIEKVVVNMGLGEATQNAKIIEVAVDELGRITGQKAVVRRAKKLAIKRVIGGGERGVSTDDLVASIKQEYKEHEDLPNTTNPDDWAKISGKKGERIVFIRTLVSQGKDAGPTGGRSIERVQTGTYL